MTTYTYHTFVYTYCMCMYLPMIYSNTQRYFSPWSAPFPTDPHVATPIAILRLGSCVNDGSHVVPFVSDAIKW